MLVQAFSKGWPLAVVGKLCAPPSSAATGDAIASEELVRAGALQEAEGLCAWAHLKDPAQHGDSEDAPATPSGPAFETIMKQMKEGDTDGLQWSADGARSSQHESDWEQQGVQLRDQTADGSGQILLLGEGRPQGGSHDGGQRRVEAGPGLRRVEVERQARARREGLCPLNGWGELDPQVLGAEEQSLVAISHSEILGVDGGLARQHALSDELEPERGDTPQGVS